MKEMKKKLCVFCSSSEDLNNIYYEMAEDFGKRLAIENFDLIHGGGSIGIMGRIMKAAYENGANVIGIVPEKLNKENIVNEKYQKLIITPDMKFRKEQMRDLSYGFIALPGGFGTLEELLEIITLKQLKYHNKPIVIYNFNSFFENILLMFKHIFVEKFANPEYNRLYFVSSDINQIFDYINNYIPENIYDKYLKH